MHLQSRFLKKYRFLIPFFVALFLVLGNFDRSQAHAYLVHSDPSDNSILEEAPKEIRLWFSEALMPELSSVRVVDLNGNPVKQLSTSVDSSDPTLMVVEIPPISPGLYTVNWSALSAIDGHPVKGLFVFNVEQDGLPASTTTRNRGFEEFVAALPEPALRSLNYLVLILAVGCIGILLWVLPGESAVGEAQASGYLSARRRILILGSVAAAGAFLVGLVQMVWQARLLAENLPQSAPLLQLVKLLVIQWPWGYAWIGRELAWLGIFIFARRMQPAEKAGMSSRNLAILASAAVLSQSLSSHATTIARPVFPVLVNTLHLIAAGLWIGGLAALVFGLRPLMRHAKLGVNDLARRSWGSFSSLAAICVGLLFASGIYSMAREVVSADALLLSPYGKFLSSKLILVLVACSVGLFNSMMLHSRLAAPLRWIFRKPAGWTPIHVSRFPRTVMIEATLGICIVALVGFLITQPPAENIAYLLSPNDQSEFVFQEMNDLIVSLTIKPNRPGTNVIMVNVANTRRPAPAETMRVIVRMKYLDRDVGVISQDASLDDTRVSMDTYRLATSSVTQPGHWSFEVIVRRKGLPDSRVVTSWTVLPLEDIGPVRLSRFPWQHDLEILAGVIIANVIILAIFFRANMRGSIKSTSKTREGTRIPIDPS